MGIGRDSTLVRRPSWILRVAALRTAVLGSESGSRDPLPPHRVGIVGATAYGMGAAIVLANAAKPTATLATRSTTATAATAAKTTVMLTTMPRGASPRHKWRDSGQLPHEADNLRKIAQAPAAVSS